MKRWKKILLVLLAVLLLAQIPFVYRRYRTGRLAEKIGQSQSQRISLSNPNYSEYKGVIHAHTALGGHSTGSFEELINAAAADGLDFVVMTEHTAELFDTSALTLRGFYGNTLFVGGQEVDAGSGDRFLLAPGAGETFQDARLPTPEFLAKYKAQGKLVLVTYPEKLNSWNADFDGIEVFSLHTNAKKMNPVLFAEDALWSYHGYPELLLTQYFARPDENLRRYDELTQAKRLTLFAGTDAHSNIGVHLFGDDAGNKLLNLKLDPYAMIFRLARNHVLLAAGQPLTTENLLAAIKSGHLFVGFDAAGDSTGFSLTAENDKESRIQGDEISLLGGVKLKAAAPLAARFVVFRDGEKVFEEAEKTEIAFDAREKGAYRVEVYQDALGAPFDRTPWIISNPVYVR